MTRWDQHHPSATNPKSKKPNHNGWAFYLTELVPAAGFELAT
jgi:hypothetical protein